MKDGDPSNMDVIYTLLQRGLEYKKARADLEQCKEAIENLVLLLNGRCGLLGKLLAAEMKLELGL